MESFLKRLIVIFAALFTDPFGSSATLAVARAQDSLDDYRSYLNHQALDNAIDKIRSSDFEEARKGAWNNVENSLGCKDSSSNDRDCDNTVAFVLIPRRDGTGSQCIRFFMMAEESLWLVESDQCFANSAFLSPPVGPLIPYVQNIRH
jgi:hypothetical protein